MRIFTDLKTEVSKVYGPLRVTLDGPDEWAHEWILHGHWAPVWLRSQQGGGGVMMCAAIISAEQVGPFLMANYNTQTANHRYAGQLSITSITRIHVFH